jgi:hypothetical protein
MISCVVLVGCQRVILAWVLIPVSVPEAGLGADRNACSVAPSGSRSSSRSGVSDPHDGLAAGLKCARQRRHAGPILQALCHVCALIIGEAGGPPEVSNRVQNFPDSWGKQRPIVSTLVHAIIRRLRWRIWGVAHGYGCRNPASSFGQQGEHQLDRA